MHNAGNAPSVTRLRNFIALIIIGVTAAFAPGAAAGCVTANVCHWDQDSNGQPDMVYVSAGPASACVDVNPGAKECSVNALVEQIEYRIWNDPVGNRDYASVFYTGVYGGYTSLYVKWDDPSDPTPDYVSFVFQTQFPAVWPAVGVSAECNDETTNPCYTRVSPLS